jgi:tetraacyldisaccharide 4'-kinase
MANWLWYGAQPGAVLTRALLSPLSAVYGAAMARRNARWDRLTPPTGLLPALSVGNLTVGGTGKTPVAAWCTQQLLARGATPAIVMRGYGDDEWRVHQLLSPDTPVLRYAARIEGLREAAHRGCNCVVLDDAFQHRAAPRVSDLVVLSADRWQPEVRLLPAGPYREPLASLRRATAAVITVKAASAMQVEALRAAVAQCAPSLPIAVVQLLPGGLRALIPAGEGAADSAPVLHGASIVLISAIGDPDALERQLRDHGARIVHHRRFPDHHRFTAGDIREIYSLLHGSSLAVCTLKDAVKLAPLWPRAGAPLWYVSQTLVVERGAEILEQECTRVLTAR